MKKFFAILLTFTFLAGTVTAYAADESADMTGADERIESMEKIGFLEVDETTHTPEGTMVEATRYDGKTSEMLVYEENDNEVIVFKSEGKENTLIITPDGECYWDEVAEKNKIEVNITSPGTTTFSTEPRITTETWVTDVTPYDDGPYTINNNMKYNTDINFNRNLGTLTLEAIMAVLIPEVAALNYFQQYFSMLTVGCDLIGIYVDLNPDLKTMYVQEQYYNGDSDTSGRPLEYCYKVHVKFAKTNSFSTFVSLSNGINYQVMYAKQLIYA